MVPYIEGSEALGILGATRLVILLNLVAFPCFWSHKASAQILNQWGLLAFTGIQFHENFSKYHSLHKKGPVDKLCPDLLHDSEAIDEHRVIKKCHIGTALDKPSLMRCLGQGQGQGSRSIGARSAGVWWNEIIILRPEWKGRLFAIRSWHYVEDSQQLAITRSSPY